MINQMNRFSPNIAELSQPLRELLSAKKAWTWGPPQQESFEKVKAEIATPSVLAHYDVTADTKVCADASSYRLGVQKQGELWKPIAFASHSLTDTERRYVYSNRERSTCAYMGLQKILRVHHWKGNSPRNRPHTPNSNIRKKEP